MDCSKWDDAGLLFASGELTEAQTIQYKEHIAVCQYCASEHSQYSKEKELLYCPGFFSEAPSTLVDEKILSLCSKPMIPTSIGIFSAPWIKRAIFSAVIFALGLGSGGYFAFAYYQTKSSASYAAAKDVAPAATPQTPATTISDSVARISHSALAHGKQVSPALGAGSSSQGIITVDLKKE